MMAGHLIRRLNQISVAAFRARMAELGADLTPVQYAALATIGENPGIDQATLAHAIAYDKATIGGVIDRLEAKALVLRRPSPTDRRARALDLSAAGRAMLEKVRPHVRAVQDDILAGLDAGEKASLIALLAKTTAAQSLRPRTSAKTRREQA